MQIENCQSNIRCDGANCKNYAAVSIKTQGHKGNINFCTECFSELMRVLENMKKDINKIKRKLK